MSFIQKAEYKKPYFKIFFDYLYLSRGEPISTLYRYLKYEGLPIPGIHGLDYKKIYITASAKMNERRAFFRSLISDYASVIKPPIGFKPLVYNDVVYFIRRNRVYTGKRRPITDLFLLILEQIIQNRIHLNELKEVNKWVKEHSESKQVVPSTRKQPKIKETHYFKFKRQEDTYQKWFDTTQRQGEWFPSARPYPREHPDYRNPVIREQLKILRQSQREQWEYKFHENPPTTRKKKIVEYPGSCDSCSAEKRHECKKDNYQRFIDGEEINLCEDKQKYAYQDYYAPWERTVTDEKEREKGDPNIEQSGKWVAKKSYDIENDDEQGNWNDWEEQQLFYRTGTDAWDRLKPWASSWFNHNDVPIRFHGKGIVSPFTNITLFYFDQHEKLIFPLPPAPASYKTVWVDAADIDFTVLRMFYTAHSKQVDIAKYLKLSEARISQILTRYRMLMRKHTPKNLSQSKEDKKIFELFLKGKQQVDIAYNIGKSQPYVSRKLKLINAHVKKRLKRHITIQNKKKYSQI
jgi:hypothetical protein